ncbi:hypothetical protein HG536_0E02770 [Torulaspora globosa]|uniref:MIF4G domain-containing protein n=1 Tax=Torulaspora globosa TaxID=48254 RepID=A0A7G3ZIN0_9SACH|nr:uncharacterized protein HG536_0E02770 [Torulaspora globosa]QLL33366.1 hypothetical protein HG536_0E02770 [Torulaspora globosa]
MHQRFNTRFTQEVFGLFLNNFTNPGEDTLSEKEELSRANRLKCNLRVFIELYLVGLFTNVDNLSSKEALPAFLQRSMAKKEPIILRLMKESLNYKFKRGLSTGIATSVLKRFPFFFNNQDTRLNVCIADDNLKELLQALFKLYGDAVIARAVELDSRTKKLFKEHQSCQFRTGKLTDEYIEEYNQCMPIYETFKAASEVFADFFNLDKPSFDQSVSEQKDEQASLSPVITNAVALPGQRLWENEETRKFYEVLLDIGDLYRASLQSEVEANGEVINDFFSNLEKTESKEEIDALTVQYWSENLDNKATKKRLIKFLIETQDWSKIRVFTRFLATNAKYFPDVIDEFTSYLDSGFRSQLHTNRINVKNIIFFSEMVKFMLLPTYMIFHKIRTLIINLQVPNNIEILTVFFEHLGIFLINKPEYKPHMEKMVELIRENKKDRQINMNLKGALDNLINLVYPPSIRSLNAESKALSPEQKFYRILIRRELENFEYRHTVKLLRKASWRNQGVYHTLFELFTKPEEISYQNIPFLARILKDLYAYQRNFVLKAIDELLENIERGLELNDYSRNMHRISQVKYLTDLYNIELIKPQVLIDTLYNIINFGFSAQDVQLFSPNSIDPTDNYFKIQLITTVLLNVTKRVRIFKDRITMFLMFLDYYVLAKAQPLPKTVKFSVEATFDKYAPETGIRRSDTAQESFMRLTQFLKIKVKAQINGSTAVVDSAVNLSEVEEEMANDNDGIDEADKDYPESGMSAAEEYEDNAEHNEDIVDEDEMDEDESLEQSDSEDGDESFNNAESDYDDIYGDVDADRDIEKRRMYEEFQKRLKDDEERRIEAEMEKQFQQILLESADSRKNEKSTGGKIPSMSSTGETSKPRLLRPEFQDRGHDRQPQKVAFTFLSKSGKKTQSRVLGLPSNVEFVSGVLEEEERLKNEREKIKEIVLQRTFD